MMNLQEKLRTEARVCPQCKNLIENPFSERCPRCLTRVPILDPGCGSCVHNAGCPVSSIKKFEQDSQSNS